jgi:hypothetical protein
VQKSRSRVGAPTGDFGERGPDDYVFFHFALDSLSPFGPIPIAAARPKPSEDEPALSV